MTTSATQRVLLSTEPKTIAVRDLNLAVLPKIVCAFAIVFGLIDGLAGRNSMGPDGISYLDMADALRHGQWGAFFNALWSPGYPFLLSIAYRILDPTPYWEFATVHLVNFFIYLAALVAFSYLMKVFFLYCQQVAADFGVVSPIRPEIWGTLGYGLFVWSSARLTSVEAVSPDMCLAVFIYLATALVLRIRIGYAAWPAYIWLGVVLGLGFYAKAPMFPLAFVFLFASILAAPDWRMGLKRASFAGIVFLMIASPLVYGLSRYEGRLTFGDSARLNYSFFINRTPRFYWNTSLQPVSQEYPAREIHSRPAVYQFTVPLQGTYPYWYDPTYWYRSIEPKLDLRGQLRELGVNLQFDTYMLWRLQPIIPLTILLLLVFNRRPESVLRDVRRHWILLAIPVTGLAMFSLVHTERRYVAPFVCILLLGLFTTLCLRNYTRLPAAFPRIMMGFVTLLMLQMSASRVHELRSLRALSAGDGAADNLSWQVSDGLKKAGLGPGDKVAWVRPQFVTTVDNYWWARLARLQITAEIPNTDGQFWQADDAARASAIRSLSQAQVKALVVSAVPPSAHLDDFIPVGSTGYYVLFYGR